MRKHIKNFIAQNIKTLNESETQSNAFKYMTVNEDTIPYIETLKGLNFDFFKWIEAFSSDLISRNVEITGEDVCFYKYTEHGLDFCINKHLSYYSMHTLSPTEKRDETPGNPSRLSTINELDETPDDSSRRSTIDKGDNRRFNTINEAVEYYAGYEGLGFKANYMTDVRGRTKPLPDGADRIITEYEISVKKTQGLDWSSIIKYEDDGGFAIIKQSPSGIKSKDPRFPNQVMFLIQKEQENYAEMFLCVTRTPGNHNTPTPGNHNTKWKIHIEILPRETVNKKIEAIKAFNSRVLGDMRAIYEKDPQDEMCFQITKGQFPSINLKRYQPSEWYYLHALDLLPSDGLVTEYKGLRGFPFTIPYYHGVSGKHQYEVYITANMDFYKFVDRGIMV